MNIQIKKYTEYTNSIKYIDTLNIQINKIYKYTKYTIILFIYIGLFILIYLFINMLFEHVIQTPRTSCSKHVVRNMRQRATHAALHRGVYESAHIEPRRSTCFLDGCSTGRLKGKVRRNC